MKMKAQCPYCAMIGDMEVENADYMVDAYGLKMYELICPRCKKDFWHGEKDASCKRSAKNVKNE